MPDRPTRPPGAERPSRKNGEARSRDLPGPPAVLIPVKKLRSAKERLAGILSADERSQLVLAMLGDLLEAVAGAGLAAYVLSPDDDVLAAATAHGAHPLRENPNATTLNEALEAAVARHFRDADSLLIILGDAPLVTSAEICALIAFADDLLLGGQGANVVVIASDREEQGTNALFLRPPGAIRLHFGARSLPAHLAEAQASGARSAVLTQPGLALDLDAAHDLASFLDCRGGLRTRELLTRLRIANRLVYRPGR